jgi:16S rRNA (adenine1518-N6/adenine1519-N6)-dimethyltransferase
MRQMMIPGRTREILRRHGITLKKSLGQNFLTDANILWEIVQAADLSEDSGVIEIGPGIGALTEQLAQHAKKVIAIELDQRLLPILQELFVDQPHVEVIHGDALQVDLHQIIATRFPEIDTLHVVANLPYYVTSPILIRLLEQKLPLQNIVIMIQKEVAERLIAKPGTKEYGSLSVLVQYYAKPTIVTRVPNTVFIPRPQVDSAVVKLDVRQEPAVHVPDEKLFFNIVRASFGQRRKVLVNALHSLFSSVTKSEIAGWLTSAGIDPKRRGETLGLEEFASLTKVIYSYQLTR